MKKVLMIICILSLITVSATAISISLAPWVEKALENQNNEIDELTLSLRQLQYDHALEDAAITRIDTYAGRRTKEVIPYDRKTQVLLEQMDQSRNKALLELNLLEMIINIDQAKHTVQNSRERYEDALEEQQSKTETSQIDALQDAYLVESRALQLKQDEKNLQRLLDEWVGVVGDEHIPSLSDQYSDPYKDIDVDGVMTVAKENSRTLFAAYRDLESKKMTFEITKAFYDSDSEQYLSNEIAYLNSKNAYEQAQKSLEVSILNQVDQLKTRYDQIQLAAMDVGIKERTLNIATSQYNEGLITSAGLASAKDSYEQANRTYLTRIYAYQKAALSFSIDTGYDF